MANPDTAAPYAETCLGMIDGFDAAAGFPDADGNPTAEPNPDALNVKASDDGKTLTIVLSYPCSYFDKMAAFASMSPVQQATVEANGEARLPVRPDLWQAPGVRQFALPVPDSLHNSDMACLLLPMQLTTAARLS